MYAKVANHELLYRVLRFLWPQLFLNAIWDFVSCGICVGISYSLLHFSFYSFWRRKMTITMGVDNDKNDKRFFITIMIDFDLPDLMKYAKGSSFHFFLEFFKNNSAIRGK